MRFEAGSVETSRTRRPASASATAVAQASDVLPTPPLPVKKSAGVGEEMKESMAGEREEAAQQQEEAGPQHEVTPRETTGSASGDAKPSRTRAANSSRDG